MTAVITAEDSPLTEQQYSSGLSASPLCNSVDTVGALKSAGGALRDR